MVFHFTSQDYSASSSEDEDDVGNVTGQQPQPCWTWPLSSYVLLSSCGGKKISRRNLRLTLFRVMLARAWHEPRPSMPVGRKAQASTDIGRLDTRHNKHWPGRNNTKRRCRVCSARGVTRTVIFRCVKCDVALCVDRNCFADYHTQKQLMTFFRPSSVQTVEASTTM